MNHRHNVTGALAARVKAGFTVNEAARRARIGPRYLRAIERSGKAPWVLARRLASLYACAVDIFSKRPEGLDTRSDSAGNLVRSRVKARRKTDRRKSAASTPRGRM